MQIRQLLLNLLKALLFAGIGFSILYLLYNKQNSNYQLYCQEEGIAVTDCNLLKKIWTDFKSVNFFWIGMVFVAFGISNISRTLRWQMLLGALGYKTKFSNAFLTIMLGYFANLGFPRIGEVIRAGTLSRYEKIPVEKTIGTVVVDRMMDLLLLLLVIGLAFVFAFNTLWGYLAENATFNKDTFFFSKFFLVASIGILGLVGIWLLRKRITNSKFGQKISNLLKGFMEGIQTIRRLEHPLVFILHSLNIWLMYYLMTYLAFFSFAPTSHLTPVVGLMVMVFGALGVALPSPGGMGAYQGLVMVALGIYGVAQSDGFSFANILFFSVQIGCNVLFGILALILLPIINNKTS
jgi:uncharacterized protein (TIRG00374 family)